MTSRQDGFVHAPRDRPLHHSRRSCSIPHDDISVILPSRSTFDVLLQTDLFITRLRCAEPVTITRLRVCCPGTSFRRLTLPHSMNASSRQASLDPSVLPASPRLSGSRLVATRCNLEFWLSVRLNQPVINLNRCPRPLVNLNRCS